MSLLILLCFLFRHLKIIWLYIVTFAHEYDLRSLVSHFLGLAETSLFSFNEGEAAYLTIYCTTQEKAFG